MMSFASGKTVLITGSTDGIGKAAAEKLLRDGAEVVLHGRSAEKGRAVREELKERTGRDCRDLLLAQLDSLDGVRLLAALTRSRHPDLRILVNNAGVYAARRAVTREGFERTFAVNYLAPVLLTRLLLDTLRANAPSRVVYVTSVLHRSAQLDFDNLQSESGYDGHAAYATSKLALVLHAAELAQRLEGTGVTVNSVHPGGVNTKLLRAGFGAGGIPVEEGAQPVVRLAADPELLNVTGQYLERTQFTTSDPRVADRDLRRRLWHHTERLLGVSWDQAAA